MLSFVDKEESEIPLQKYGEFLYDNLILFAPKVDGMYLKRATQGSEMDDKYTLEINDGNHLQ